MNQDNNNQTINSATPPEGINLNYFKEVIENSGLSEKFPNLNNKWKNDTVQPIKTATDQEKIEAYDKLNIKDLPEDWELKLARVKELDKNQADYIEKKEELKGWTDTFTDKKPEQVQEEIKQLEESKKQIEEELNAKITDLEANLAIEKQEKQTILTNSEQKIKDLENDLKQWTQAFNGRELAEVLEELEVLKKRPDLSISEDQFWDDYAERKTIEQNKLDSEELEQEKKNVEDYKEKTRKLLFIINRFCKAAIIRRYIMAKPVLTTKEAQAEIADLLEKTEQRLSNYLENGNKLPQIISLLQSNNKHMENKEIFDKVDQDFILELTLWEKEKEAHAREVLEQIRKVKETSDYEKLFEEWSGGKNYNEENDFDGSLALLKRLLDIKEIEPAL